MYHFSRRLHSQNILFLFLAFFLAFQGNAALPVYLLKQTAPIDISTLDRITVDSTRSIYRLQLFDTRARLRVKFSFEFENKETGVGHEIIQEREVFDTNFTRISSYVTDSSGYQGVFELKDGSLRLEYSGGFLRYGRIRVGGWEQECWYPTEVIQGFSLPLIQQIYGQSLPHSDNVAFHIDESRCQIHDAGILTSQTRSVGDSSYSNTFFKNGHLQSQSIGFQGKTWDQSTTYSNEWDSTGIPKVLHEIEPDGHLHRRRYFPNGSLMTEMYLIRDKMDGEYRGYTESGKLESRGEYRNGKEIHYEWVDTTQTDERKP